MKKCVVFLSVFACCVFSGCMGPKTSGVMVEKGRLFIEDPAFAANIEVVGDMRGKTNEGFLRAQVTLKNTNRGDFRCQYRFEWRDANGMMQTHQSSPWCPLLFHGREVKVLDAVSLQKNATDFRLALRREGGN